MSGKGGEEEDENHTPSCQCLFYKGYCVCSYQVYAHECANNRVNNPTRSRSPSPSLAPTPTWSEMNLENGSPTEGVEETNGTTPTWSEMNLENGSPTEGVEETNGTTPTWSEMNLENGSPTEGGEETNRIRTMIFCSECELNYQFDDFISNVHACFKLPIGFNLEPVQDEVLPAKKQSGLLCEICGKTYNSKEIHCISCHHNYTLENFRQEGHTCFNLPPSLNIESVSASGKRKLLRQTSKFTKKKKRRPSSPVEDIIYFSSEPLEEDLIFDNILSKNRVLYIV